MKKGKFLFFDIECCNGHDICSFGYCIFDANLHLLEKRDILINPETRFRLQNAKRGFALSYPEEAFYKQDAFPFYYPKIKELLVERNYILLGHCPNSDFSFLNMACKRYNLPYFHICAFDTQKVYKKLFNRPTIETLEKILSALEIESECLTFHKSCDDAFASFLAIKEIGWRKEMSVEELIESNSDCLIFNNIETFLAQQKKIYN